MARNAEIVIVVTGTEEFREVARKLKAAGNGGLTRNLRRRMRDAGNPLLSAGRRNALNMNSSGRGHTGLRAAVARATTIEVKMSGKNVGVRMRCAAGRMPPKQRNLPAAMNRGRIRHPVHGNREVWVTQIVTPPDWFDRAAHEKGPGVRDAAAWAVKETNDEIAGA